MKKILPRLALLAAPFLVYFALFFAFEPYDYFGVKGGASSEDSVITRVRAYLSAPEDAIILGDSRMAHFDMNAVAEASGRGWSNLAFGGASLNESIDLFYLAAENNPSLNTCYFGVSFYTLRAGDSRNRMEAIGTVVSCHVIPRPHGAVGETMPDMKYGEGHVCWLSFCCACRACRRARPGTQALGRRSILWTRTATRCPYAAT